jgi:hypothetical protein
LSRAGRGVHQQHDERDQSSWFTTAESKLHGIVPEIHDHPSLSSQQQIM